MRLKAGTLTLSLVLCALPSTGNAEWRAQLVARSAPDEPFRAAPANALVGETVEVTVALVDRRGRVYANVEELALRRRARPPRGPLPEGVEIRWLEVEPRQLHSEHPPPNDGNPHFSNSVLFGPNHGEWLGFDILEYDTVPLRSDVGALDRRDRFELRSAHPNGGHPDRGGAGSNWYAAEVRLPDGSVVRSPDGGSTDSRGLLRPVLRVSYRASDDYLGWLSTYFNVPNLFGSGGVGENHQTDRYVGADCADVLVGALRASGRDVEYTSVAGIGRLARPVTETVLLHEDGRITDTEGLAVRVLWGSEVQPGDLIAIDYSTIPAEVLPREWDHIGALVRDGGPAGPNGVFDAFDIMRHIGGLGLEDEALLRHLPIRARVWRWR